MTIAIGLRVKEGLVLGVDSAVSRNGSHVAFVRKLFQANRLGCVFLGSVTLGHNTGYDLLRKVSERAHDADAWSFASLLADEARMAYSINPSPLSQEFQFWLAGQEGDGFEVFSFRYLPPEIDLCVKSDGDWMRNLGYRTGNRSEFRAHYYGQLEEFAAGQGLPVQEMMVLAGDYQDSVEMTVNQTANLCEWLLSIELELARVAGRSGSIGGSCLIAAITSEGFSWIKNCMQLPAPSWNGS